MSQDHRHRGYTDVGDGWLIFDLPEADNALTVGNVLDNGYLTVGDINAGSSRGPTGDGRMKPNLVGPGTVVTSASAGTTNG